MKDYMKRETLTQDDGWTGPWRDIDLYGAGHNKRINNEKRKHKLTTYKKQLTNELIDAIETVCGACPYISECQITDELANQMGFDDDTPYDSGEKYCERCMVRRMYELFYAEDENDDYLPMSAPEWQAIINY